MLALLAPLPLATRSWVHPMYGKSPSPLGLWQDGRGVEVSLHFPLSRQHLDTGRRKQGRKRPRRGLCGPSQEPDTSDISSKCRSPGPRRARVPLQPHGQMMLCELALPTGTPPAGGLEGRSGENRWEKSSQAPLPLAQRSSASSEAGAPCRGDGLCQGPDLHCAQRDCGD